MAKKKKTAPKKTQKKGSKPSKNLTPGIKKKKKKQHDKGGPPLNK
jgi:hypothetical protein